MQLLLLCALFFLSLSPAWRDPGVCFNRPAAVLARYYNNTLATSRALLPYLQAIPYIFLCSNRKMQPPHRVQLDFDFTLLFLLAGDISLNPGPSVHGLCLRTVNARSMQDKAPALSDLVTSKRNYLLDITETWLTTKETSADLAKMTPPAPPLHLGFSFFQEPRARRTGGEVRLFVSSANKVSAISLPTQTSFEAISDKLQCGHSCLIILRNQSPPTRSCYYFLHWVTRYYVLHFYPLSWCGSAGGFQSSYWFLIIRCHLVFWSLSISINMLTFLPTFTVILSILWFLLLQDTIFSLFWLLIWFLDHVPVVVNLHIPSIHSRTIHQTIKYRKLQSINIEGFKADIKTSKLIRYPKTSETDLAQQYDSVIHTLVNRHALLFTKKIFLKPPNSWMTPGILTSKRHRRYLEHVWRRNPIALNRSRVTKQTHLCYRQMSKAKSAHYSKINAEHSGDYGLLWKAFNKVLHRCPKMPLPDHSSIDALVNTFSSFSINEISLIRSSFLSDSHSRVLNPPDTRKVLQNSTFVTADEVRLPTGSMQVFWFRPYTY